MAGLQKLPPTFYVFYSDDFATKISIPTPAEKEHKNFLCQIFVTLTTEAGLSWDVDIEKIDGAYHFTDGWSEFVNDNNLVDRQLLLFHIVGDSTLHVSIFGDHCWLQPPRCYQMVVATPATNPAATTWRMVKKLKQDNFIRDQRLSIPRLFAEGTGVARSGKAVLETGDGREWPVRVTVRGRGAQIMYSMTGGWLKFVRGNNLGVGSILLFGSVPASANVVNVTVMENEAGEELLRQAKYGGLL